MSILSSTFVVLLTAVLAVAPVRADSPGPTEVVNDFHETLLGVMKVADALGVQGRYEKLLPPLSEAFDFQKMVQFASGSSWKNATEEQRSQLVEAFTRMSVSNYASQFSGYSGESFETIGQREGPRGSILVDTQIIRNPDPPVAITYVLNESGGQWRIVDVLLDKKISQMAVSRSEYNPILRQGGPEALVNALNAKSDKLLAE